MIHTAETEDGTILKSKYFYHTGNSTYSQNRISEIEKIESYKNGQLLETKKINYANNWNANVSYLPYQVQTAFGNSTLDTELTYDKYDSNGNLQQYTAKDGVPVFIIWGYNNTQVIAKIIGTRFVSNNLIDIAVAASNQDALNPANEPALITALDNLRKDPSFSGYQISTYTYDPLIGVTTITPPSGIREIYKYDAANRLENIKNINGKLLKEFKYNYKP